MQHTMSCAATDSFAICSIAIDVQLRVRDSSVLDDFFYSGDCEVNGYLRCVHQNIRHCRFAVQNQRSVRQQGFNISISTECMSCLAVFLQKEKLMDRTLPPRLRVGDCEVEAKARV